MKHDHKWTTVIIYQFNLTSWNIWILFLFLFTWWWSMLFLVAIGLLTNNFVENILTIDSEKKKSTSVKSMEFSYQHSTNLIQHKSKIKVSLSNLGSFLFLWSWGSLLRKFLPIMDETRHLSSTYRSSHPEVFYEIGVLKICSKFTGEQPYWIAISIKLLCNFIEIALRHEKLY